MSFLKETIIDLKAKHKTNGIKIRRLDEGLSRRAVMKMIRSKFDLGAEQTYSEAQKGQRMVKLYNIKSDVKSAGDMVKEINDYIKTKNIPGVTAREMKTGMTGWRRGTPSIAFQFDNEVYGT